MPLIRRLPKRGFTNIFRKEYNIVNLGDLAKTGLDEIKIGDYFEKKLARNRKAEIKVLANGEMKRKVTIHAHRFSKGALEKIKQAGGQAILYKGEQN